MTDFDTSIFVAKFVEEARDRVKALGEALLRLEKSPDTPAAAAEAMREAHSIKGSALMLGFGDIAQIAHQLEDLFVAAKLAIRHGPLTPAKIGVPYSARLARSGGVSPIKWSVVDPTKLPPGVRLNAKTGRLYGVARHAGTYRFQVEVTDALNARSRGATIRPCSPASTNLSPPSPPPPAAARSASCGSRPKACNPSSMPSAAAR